MYELGRVAREEYDVKWAEIQEQRARLSERPAALFTQQQSVCVHWWTTGTR